MVASTRIAEFDTWRPGYAGASVQVLIAGTASLASIFSDANLTVSAANPVTLSTLTDVNDRTYGKFAVPLYVGVAYTLLVSDGTSTGVVTLPLTALDGADASLTTVQSVRGDYAVVMDVFLDRDIEATLYGSLNSADGSAVCNATLDAAIGAAAANGGGQVLLPPGNIPFLTLTLPQGVVLKGKGKGATILSSTQTSAPVITLGGDGAGLEDMSLDGQTLNPQSIGLAGVNIDQIVFNRVVVKRFETGLRLRGAANEVWNDFTVTNCTNGADLRGDLDTGVTSGGTEVVNVHWMGGEVSQCTTFGLRLFFLDAQVRDCVFENVNFIVNSGDAVRIKGARGIAFDTCQWANNIGNVVVNDGDNVAYLAQNTVERIRFNGGRMDHGTNTFNDTCLDIQFSGMELLGVSNVLTVPGNAIIFDDCIEDAQVSFTGDLTKTVQRNSTASVGEFAGVTTDATPTPAWQRILAPGDVVFVTAKVIARQRNGVDTGVFWVMGAATKAGSVLPFQGGTGPFVAGQVATGHTSGASARITAVTGDGVTGTITLRDIVGTFVSGEIVSDTNTGSAQFIGVVTNTNAALDGLGSEAIRVAQTSGPTWTVAVTVSGSIIRVVVTGEAAKTIEWTLEVSAMQP